MSIRCWLLGHVWTYFNVCWENKLGERQTLANGVCRRCYKFKSQDLYDGQISVVENHPTAELFDGRST